MDRIEITDDETESAFQEFIDEVEFIINLNVNSCDEKLVTLAKINMQESLDKYIMMHTNLVVNQLKEDGIIVSM